MGTVEIGCINAPDRRRHRQEAPKRLYGDAGGVWGFFSWIFVARGGPGLPPFVPHVALALGVLKR